MNTWEIVGLVLGSGTVGSVVTQITKSMLTKKVTDYDAVKSGFKEIIDELQERREHYLEEIRELKVEVEKLKTARFEDSKLISELREESRLLKWSINHSGRRAFSEVLPIWKRDLNGKLTFINPAISSEWGVKSIYDLGSEYFHSIPDDLMDMYKKHDNMVIKAQKAHMFIGEPIKRGVAKNAEIFKAAVLREPIFDPVTGEIQEVLGVIIPYNKNTDYVIDNLIVVNVDANPKQD